MTIGGNHVGTVEDVSTQRQCNHHRACSGRGSDRASAALGGPDDVASVNGVAPETVAYHALRGIVEESNEQAQRWRDAARRAEREGKPVLALLFRNESEGRGI